MKKYIVVFITASCLKEAGKIADALLSKRFVACVNIIKGVDSFFTWKRKKERAKEILLIAKTEFSRFSEVEKLVKKNHSYETPEIIAIPIMTGNKEYLKWIEDSVR